jgi:hypothetical protein
MTGLSDEAETLLGRIAATWPDPMTLAPEPKELMELREADLVEQWDMHPNGDRRWMVTQAGLDRSGPRP